MTRDDFTPPPSLPPGERSSVVRRFLERYFADEERGALGELADYQRAFPGHEAAIAEAWAGMATVAGGAQLIGAAPSLEPTFEGLQVGPYVLAERLGEGGQGVVHAAHDSRLQRTVAVKLLTRVRLSGDDTRVRRFRREAELAARLDHPGLCAVYDAGIQGELPYLVMPRVEGVTLAQRLADDGALQVDDACALVERVARALHVAHEAGIVHRDIKPANVVVTPAGEPVLMDFGIARDLDAGGTLTVTGELLGTLPYMAPEQLAADGRALDRRVDVHALGVLLFECLTGRLPFDAPTQRALMDAISHDVAPDVRRVVDGVPRDLAVVLGVALAKEPERRMRSAEALADELQRVRERRPIASRPATVGLRLRRWVRREPRVAAGVFAAFALLTGGLITALVLLDRVDEQRAAKEGALVEMEAERNAKDDALLAMRAERNAKDDALQEMRAERDAKQAALDEIAVLADKSRLDELLADLEAFEPPRPEHVPGMTRWLERADALVARLPLHEDALAELEARAREPTSAEREAVVAKHPEAARRARNAALRDLLSARSAAGEGHIALGAAGSVDEVRDHAAAVVAELDAELDALPVVRFDDDRDAWRHGLETQIVEGLRALRSNDVFGATRARVEQLLAFAADIRARSVDEHAAAWEQALDAVAADERFAGFTFAEQVGLVPLGADPDTGLQEFAHLLTGEAAVRDGSTNRLVCGEATGLVFVLVPGGETIIGAEPGALGQPHRDPRAMPGEFPAALVELAPYLISKFELTQGQWLRATGHNPSTYVPGKQYDAEPITLWHPLESVSWDMATAVCARLGLALPTSAQWEHAARAGSMTVYPWGDDDASCAGRLNLMDRALERLAGTSFGPAVAPFDDGFAATAPPGSYPANAFGLHDVLGNVTELCLDEDHRNETPRRPGDGRVLLGDPRMITMRGGSSRSPLGEPRSAARMRQPADLIDVTTGLRPVLPLTP